MIKALTHCFLAVYLSFLKPSSPPPSSPLLLFLATQSQSLSWNKVERLLTVFISASLRRSSRPNPSGKLFWVIITWSCVEKQKRTKWKNPSETEGGIRGRRWLGSSAPLLGPHVVWPYRLMCHSGTSAGFTPHSLSHQLSRFHMESSGAAGELLWAAILRALMQMLHILPVVNSFVLFFPPSPLLVVIVSCFYRKLGNIGSYMTSSYSNLVIQIFMIFECYFMLLLIQKILLLSTYWQLSHCCINDNFI